MTAPVLSSGELSVRSDASGGEVLAQVAGSLGAYGSQLVFLFHGYNDSFTVAHQSYASFFQNFPGPGNPLHDKWQPAIHSCYWPGDKAWGKFSALSYALELQPAQDSAKAFADFLATLPAPAGGTLDVYFIAHSLGNRVVLELLSALENMKAAGALSSQMQFKGFCMMAAAVPVSMVESNGPLYQSAILSATRRTLYSEADTVLHFAFPIGETAAREGFFPTAIGRYGQPQSNWTAETEMFISPSHGYNHGDYWSQPNTIPQISAFFGIPTAAAPASTFIPAHALPAPDSIAQNQISSRSLPSSPSFG
ncbi:MAG: alpha/beta hydrolase [Candidatus Acidiferrales bacterium]